MIHKVFTSWSSVCTYEHNLQTEWIWVTVHSAWLKWARLTLYDYQYVHISTTYTLSESESTSTGHDWNDQVFHRVTVYRARLEWAMFSHYRQCVHMSTTYRLSESKSQSTRHSWKLEWANFYAMIISVYTWVQLTSWMNLIASHHPQDMVGMYQEFIMHIHRYDHSLRTF